MLNKLFENPSAKLQKLLKFLFIATTGAGVLGEIIYNIVQIVKYSKYGNGGMIVLSVFLMFLTPILFAFFNYVSYLFSYMLLDFFTDIHEIRKQKEQ